MRSRDILRQARVLGGVSQVELARRTGVAQPTISAYERGVHEPSLATLRTLVAGSGLEMDVVLRRPGERRGLPTTSTGRLLRTKASELISAARRLGAANVRVFGSVARGEDGPDSDIDLLVDLESGTGLIGLGRLQHAFESVLGRAVDVVPASGLKPSLRTDVLAEAISLEQA